MSETPARPPDDARHLEVEPYDDDERAEAPDWYQGDTQ